MDVLQIAIKELRELVAGGAFPMSKAVSMIKEIRISIQTYEDMVDYSKLAISKERLKNMVGLIRQLNRTLTDSPISITDPRYSNQVRNGTMSLSGDNISHSTRLFRDITKNIKYEQFDLNKL